MAASPYGGPAAGTPPPARPKHATLLSVSHDGQSQSTCASSSCCELQPGHLNVARMLCLHTRAAVHSAPTNSSRIREASSSVDATRSAVRHASRRTRPRARHGLPGGRPPARAWHDITDYPASCAGSAARAGAPGVAALSGPALPITTSPLVAANRAGGQRARCARRTLSSGAGGWCPRWPAQGLAQVLGCAQWVIWSTRS